MTMLLLGVWALISLLSSRRTLIAALFLFWAFSFYLHSGEVSSIPHTRWVLVHPWHFIASGYQALNPGYVVVVSNGQEYVFILHYCLIIL